MWLFSNHIIFSIAIYRLNCSIILCIFIVAYFALMAVNVLAFMSNLKQMKGLLIGVAQSCL